MSLRFFVSREEGGVRLDRFLAGALALEGRASPSRSELQRWIERGNVRIDGAPGKASSKVRAGASVSVEPLPPPSTAAEADASVRFDVLYTDASVVVVNKPAGLVVHPARGHGTGTLVNGLIALGIFDQALSTGLVEEATRPGIVHRIDKGTSGVMVVARTPEAREALKRQFADHSIERRYVALCVGRVETATFETLHGRHPTDRLRFSSRVREGKRAVTHVERVELFGDGATMVRCRLETGRTHQIRVHLSDHKTPLLGDSLYGRPPGDLRLREIGRELARPALHAEVLGFVHPETGQRVVFHAPPPEDFERAVTALRAIR